MSKFKTIVLMIIIGGIHTGLAVADENENETSKTKETCMELTGYPTDYYGVCSEIDGKKDEDKSD